MKLKIVIILALVTIYCFYCSEVISESKITYSINNETKKQGSEEDLENDFLKTLEAQLESSKNKNNKEAKEITETISNMLHSMGTHIINETEELRKTIVITIINEDGYFYIGKLEAFPCNINNLDRLQIGSHKIYTALDKLYHDNTQNIVILNIKNDIKYEYVYKVLDSIETYLSDKNSHNKDFEYIKYMFAKPLLKDKKEQINLQF